MHELLTPLFLLLLAVFFFLAGGVCVFLYNMATESKSSLPIFFTRSKKTGDLGERRYQNLDAIPNKHLKNHVPEDFFLNSSDSQMSQKQNYIMHMKRINQFIEDQDNGRHLS